MIIFIKLVIQKINQIQTIVTTRSTHIFNPSEEIKIEVWEENF